MNKVIVIFPTALRHLRGVDKAVRRLGKVTEALTEELRKV